MKWSLNGTFVEGTKGELVCEKRLDGYVDQRTVILIIIIMIMIAYVVGRLAQLHAN
jgi:hypothetical protein